MEEKLKARIADCTMRICRKYNALTALLNPLAGSSVVLQQYLRRVSSVLNYAKERYQNASEINLAICKQRHDPARLLSEVESRFNELEQGFYHVYPDAGFRERLRACFNATRGDFDELENCLSAIV